MDVFLFALSGIDPLDESEMATEVDGNHPVIRYIADVRKEPPPPDEIEWPWPINELPDGAGGGRSDGIPFTNQFSVLEMLGYTVGKTQGLAPAGRKRFLNLFFRNELPGSVEKYFSGDCGTLGSQMRLLKMANVIAAHTRNAKRNDREKCRFAIEDWEEDLEYLKTTYYDKGRFAFPWPEIEPRQRSRHGDTLVGHHAGDRLMQPQNRFHEPLLDGDSESETVGCRHSNPAVCKHNELSGTCAFVRPDTICKKPPRSWPKRYRELLERLKA